jgi:predicted RNA-binding Zn ribbon-like protein
MPAYTRCGVDACEVKPPTESPAAAASDRPDAQPLFVEFVNTLHWYEGTPVELIGTQSDFNTWLLEHDLPSDDDLTGYLPDVHRLREHVRGITEALASRRPMRDADLAALQGALSAPTGSLTLVHANAPQLQPHLTLATNVTGAVLFSFRVALSIAVFFRSPLRNRLKLCANPGCGFAFVDTSINATRRWCFMRYCGNRLKVRAFRRRQTPTRRTSVHKR